MIKKKINKYFVIFKLFSLTEVAKFLCEMSEDSKISYSINESLVSYSDNKKTTTKTTQLSPSSMKILSIVNQFRENHLFKEILRFLEYNVYLKTDRCFQYNNNENCGFISYKNGKKIDLSVNGYFEQLKENISKNFKIGENHVR